MSEQNGKPRVVLHEKEQDVVLVDREGREHEYVVGEMDDEGLAAYLRAVDDSYVTDDKGKVLSQNYGGLHALLVSLTLREKVTGRKVNLDEAKGYGPAAKGMLYKMAQDVNGLSARVRAEEKKESPNGDTSGTGSDLQTASSSAV